MFDNGLHWKIKQQDSNNYLVFYNICTIWQEAANSHSASHAIQSYNHIANIFRP